MNKDKSQKITKTTKELFIMSAMKRELENKIKQDLDNKSEEKSLLLDQFKKGKIDLEAYVNGMNAIDGMRLMNGELS